MRLKQKGETDTTRRRVERSNRRGTESWKNCNKARTIVQGYTAVKGECRTHKRKAGSGRLYL